MQMDRKRIGGLLTLIFFMIAGIGIQSAIFPSSGLNSQKINSCTVIDEPGRYKLSTDIRNGGGTKISQSCIEIRSENVVFDGNGHTIQGRGNSHTTAIQVKAPNNSTGVKIKDVRITDWHKGIVYQNSVAGKIHNVTAVSNVYGASIENSRLVVTRDNTWRKNMIGIKTSDTSTLISLGGHSFNKNKINKI